MDIHTWLENWQKKHVVLFSGGHSSGRVAIEVARRFGSENTILLNHDINARVEHEDIKRFKREVAAYLGIPITYANYANPDFDQFDVALKHSAWKTGHDSVICTSRLKTEPFMKWLSEFPDAKKAVYYYGFDATETKRILRRSSIMASDGYRTAFPLAHWTSTISSTKEIGIEPPLTYDVFKHANCTGCVKGGRQHWYAVYCTRPDLFEKAKAAEDKIGYSIMKDETLEECERLFASMKKYGVKPTEHVDARTFWAQIRKLGLETCEISNEDAKPCECVF